MKITLEERRKPFNKQLKVFLILHPHFRFVISIIVLLLWFVFSPFIGIIIFFRKLPGNIIVEFEEMKRNKKLQA